MKAEMSEDGVITIRPESSVEAYALRHWSDKASFAVETEDGVQGRIDSRYLLINADWIPTGTYVRTEKP